MRIPWAMQSRDTWANLAQAHLALARVWENILDFTHAGEEYEQALALRQCGGFAGK